MIHPIHWLTLHGLFATLALLFYVISSHVMQQRRSPTAAIAWVIFMLLLPYLALPAYWTFGFRKLPRPRSAPLPRAPHSQHANSWVVRMALALGQPEPAAYRELKIHSGGHDARRALLDTIEAARHSIDICTFLVGRDKLGDAVIERLCHQARSGIHVRLLLDGLGSLMGGRPSLKPLADAGGTWSLFVPPLGSPRKARTNLRNHRKLLIIDADHETGRLWCGGRNLAAEYFEGEPKAPPWHDLSFDLRGPIVKQAQSLFEHDWAFANDLPRPPDPASPRPEESPADGATLIASGPDQADDTIHALLVAACYRAQHRIALVTPYFVPDDALLAALCLAARRGVTVDLLVPERSNHRLSDLARVRALRTVTQVGARVWLAPEMLHAKLVVVDETLALAGSANLDTRSLFLNYELMLAFQNPVDVRRFAAWSEQERTAMRPYVAKQPGIIRDVAEGLLLWVGFQL